MAVRASRFSALIVVLAAVAVFSPAGSASQRDAGLPTLYVAYNLNCTFGITDDSGKAISQIAPGSYQIQVTTPVVFADVDLSGIYDMTACKSFVQFSISGPGVSVATTLQDGDEDYGLLDATFKPGSSYVASDGNQPSVARLAFTTASSGSPVIPTSPVNSNTSGKGSTQSDVVGSNKHSTSTAAVAQRGTLTATVNSSGSVTLRYEGKLVSSLRSGLYTVKVSDSSTKSGFVIQQIHKSATAVSTAPYTGTKRKSIDLTKGQWFFYPSFIGKKTYFIVTA